VVSRHRLIEAFLVKVMGVPWDEVHEEAEAFEMGVTPALEARMLDMIGEARTCPHGHPIGDYPREPGEAIPAVPVGSEVVVLRLENEAEEMLHYLKARGVEPGRSYTVSDRRGHGDDAVTELVDIDAGTTHEVDDRLARTVSVIVASRGDGAVSDIVEAGAELQLLGATRWGM
jgi:DtxR family Mn-dependent transcriptional regulator